LINFEILSFFQKYKSVSIISRFYFFFRHKCNSIRNSNLIFIVLFKYRKQRLIVDVFLFLKSKSVRSSKQININSWIFEFFSSTMNDDRIFFKIIMLILNSNNFYLWIEDLKDLILKIKIWEYINSYDKIEESREEVLSEISHFVVKKSDLALSAVVDDFIINQLINLRKISHNFVSQNIFMNCRLNNKKIIEQMWKSTNEKKSKSRKSFKKCSK
jgi:hypothetical protein